VGTFKRLLTLAVLLLTLPLWGNEFCLLDFGYLSGTIGFLKCKNLQRNATYSVILQKDGEKKVFTYKGVNTEDYLPFAVPFYWKGKVLLEFLKNGLPLAVVKLNVVQPDRGISRIFIRKKVYKGETPQRGNDRTTYRRLVSEQYSLVRRILKTYTPQRFYESKAIFPLKVYKRISSPFGVRRFVNGRPSGFHKGVDLAAPMGTPVYATLSGRVIFAGRLLLTGNTVIIDHGWGLMSLYAHLSRIEVKKGEFVHRGEEIGKVGSTGRSTGPHLHFGIYLNDTAVDPLDFLKKKLKPAEGGEGLNPPTSKR